MGFACATSVAVVGVEGHLVQVEADVAQGLPQLVITGLGDLAVVQARDRVRAAVVNSGQPWPPGRITVGLSPAWLPKHGTGLDLAIAAAVLAAAAAIDPTSLGHIALIGELGLDGTLRRIRGVLPAVLTAARRGIPRVAVPAPNLAEARLVPGIDVVGMSRLLDLPAALRGESCDEPAMPADPIESKLGHETDLSDVVGQELGRLAVEIAAAGGHHLALFGPPGAGKTMLSERLPGLLPSLDTESALEVSAVHSVAGVLSDGSPLVRRPPYQAPHHSATVPALVGGGTGLAKPGAISLAHRGVLFLDEAPEFPARALDALRQPLERGEVVLARSGGTIRYPARFQLVIAANPCPCATGTTECECSPATRRRYFGRLSGPLLDRIDIQVDLLPLTAASLLSDSGVAESTEVVAKRVVDARSAASHRWRSHGWETNADVPGRALRGPLRLPRSVTSAVDTMVDRGQLSARGYDRVLRLAWTVADLSGLDRPGRAELNEATFLRTRGAA